MGTWNNTSVASLKKTNNADDNEGEEAEGGYHSNTGHSSSRECMGWQMGLLRDEKILDNMKSANEKEEGEEEEEKDLEAGSPDVKVPNSPAYSTKKRTAQSPKGKGTLSPLAGEAKKKRGRGKKK